MSEVGAGKDPRVLPGLLVRDADGKALGRVTRADPMGFEVVRGFWSPSEWVIRWDEVLEVTSTEVRVARSDGALFELAAGRLPAIWARPPARR